jgi:hypothetical protein
MVIFIVQVCREEDNIHSTANLPDMKEEEEEKYIALAHCPGTSN